MESRIKTTKGYSEICIGNEPVIKVYDDYFSSDVPFSSDMAELIAHQIADKVVDKLPKIVDGLENIAVKFDGKEVEFYWDSGDVWRYGIRTKKDALKLAKEFIRLYMLEELPKPKEPNITIKQQFGRWTVRKNGRRIASFSSKSEAEEFYNEKGRDMSEIFNYSGLKSFSLKWDRSIRSTSLNNSEFKTYCQLLMDYMDSEGWD